MSNISATSQNQVISRRRYQISGVVQGVGFRPFVYGLAQRFGLRGFVGNDSSGVFIEVEGPISDLEAFQQALQDETPPLAQIDSLQVERLSPQNDNDFVIVKSQAKASQRTLISPDMCICDDCLRELFDPQDRRYRYPFINCTNCGPRFTIVKDVPYDRPLTTMRHFPLCPTCQSEYDDPLNRRFHAQPNACAHCGPQVEFRWAKHSDLHNFTNLVQLERQGKAAIRLTQSVIEQGGVVAIKGLGGFHLACDASNNQAVQLLRQRKGRVDKPFALMVDSLDKAHQLAEISAQEADLLWAKERPIVLLKKKADAPLSEFVAPGNDYVGLMLAYTPLHYLLLAESKSPAWVMTSGNFSSEPIAIDNTFALENLSSLADGFLLHNRDIHVPCDDSVVRVFQGAELPIRRSRGYAPFPVKLPFEMPPVLALGGELKATFCLSKDNYAFMSQHIGDMENLETLTAFEKAVAHFQAIFRVEPKLLVSDMHPSYLSTQWGKENYQGQAYQQVQHHHAHIASVMAENGLPPSETVIGFSFDGTGFGLDGKIWGGEVFIANYTTFERAAHLKYVPLPGGDTAVKRPYRTALAHLWAAELPWEDGLPPVAACTDLEQSVIRRQLETGLNAVQTSSMGRLFDAVAALAGVRQTVSYEAQAAIQLEALYQPEIGESYSFCLQSQHPDAPLQFDPAPVFRQIVTDVKAGLSPNTISAKFHHAVANLILDVSLTMRGKTGLNTVALSGGVFQNIRLLKLSLQGLEQAKFRVLTHRQLPPNDGGLALGQVVIAGLKSKNQTG